MQTQRPAILDDADVETELGSLRVPLIEALKWMVEQEYMDAPFVVVMTKAGPSAMVCFGPDPDGLLSVDVPVDYVKNHSMAREIVGEDAPDVHLRCFSRPRSTIADAVDVTLRAFRELWDIPSASLLRISRGKGMRELN